MEHRVSRGLEVMMKREEGRKWSKSKSGCGLLVDGRLSKEFGNALQADQPCARVTSE
jgi:hypothetical protein